MKVVLAPDKFKHCLSAEEVCAALEDGLRRVRPSYEIVALPLADGGEGTVHCLHRALGGRLIQGSVRGPLGQPGRQATWLLLGDALLGTTGTTGTTPDPAGSSSARAEPTAVVELASASGLQGLPKADRNPMRTTTYGTGQLVSAALDAGARRLILAAGGSATVDGGCGMAQALGVHFLDREGRTIAIPMTGRAMTEAADIDIRETRPELRPLPGKHGGVRLELAVDVHNPLCGPNGAAHVYGPQKGAAREDVVRLDAGLANLAEIIRRRTGVEVLGVPGMGAAGGIGACVVGLLNGSIRKGSALVLEMVRFHEAIRGADLIITGEGRLDAQSDQGKVIHAVVQAATLGTTARVPVWAVVGSAAEDARALKDRLAGCISLTDLAGDKDRAMRDARTLLGRAAAIIVKGMAGP